ncbi:MAG: P-loop NTPase [Betaproteobacteria bacterium]|nr:P-loop NTPase [Betaproteobacteria bacterium]
MSNDPASPGPKASRDELFAAAEALRRRVHELEEEKRDLEVMLETSSAHADHLAEELEAERNDLATMLEMTTEHADTVEDELHERAAATLLKSARELRMIVEATPAPVMISRLADGEIVYANVMLGSLFQIAANELVGRKALDLYYDAADRQPLIETLEKEKSVDRQEVRLKRPDGALIWVEISLRLLDFNDEPSILSALHDITDRKAAEERLQQQVEALRVELEETSSNSQLARTTGTTRFENLDAAAIKRGSTQLVAVHSFRGGNGKSSITANVAALLAADGQRVGVIDTDIQSPGLHVMLGQAGMDLRHTLNDFLLGNCGIDQIALDVTSRLAEPVPGQVFLIPASINPGTMAQILSQGYEAQRLAQSFFELGELLGLDTLLIDTHPGLNEEALLTMRAVQTLLVVLRPDSQDFEGTGVTVQVARQLEVPRILLVVNQLPQIGQRQAVRERAKGTFNCDVIAVIPQSPEFMLFTGDGPFVLRNLDSPVTLALRQVAHGITSVTA